MSGPLSQRTIALAEGRQLEDLAQMLEKEGAQIVRCPLLSILDFPDAGPVLTWLHHLIQGRCDWVVILTGEGVRRLLSCAERHGLLEDAVAAFGRTRLVVRGPKPIQALKTIGVKPSLIATKPTTEGVIETLRNERLKDQTVGVQLYRESNVPLTDFLTKAGARILTVQPYIYAPASDANHVVQLIAGLAEGRIDSIIFTSSPQIDRLLEVAEEQGKMDELRAGLDRAQVAAVGPIVQETLEKAGFCVDVCPEQGFVMKNLVQLLKKQG